MSDITDMCQFARAHVMLSVKWAWIALPANLIPKGIYNIK